MMKALAVTFGSFVCALGLAHAGDFAKGEILVKYRSDVSRDRASMNTFYSINEIQSVYRFDGMMSGYEKLIIPSEKPVREALKQILQDPLVESAQPNYILKTQPMSLPKNSSANCSGLFGCTIGHLGDGWPGGGPGPKPTLRPDVSPMPAEVTPPVEDPLLGDLYGLKKIGAIEAWKIYRGTRKVIVADIDTGIDYNHEDLAENLWRKSSGVHGDVVGYDFIHNDELPFDDNMHGTHTAGTIGATGGNGKGIAGVSPNVTLMALKFLNDQGSGTTADAIRAIDYAVKNGAKILSNSWGGPAEADNDALKEAILRTVKANVLFVVAAGNESTDNDSDKASYPAAFNTENMISVAATDSTDHLAFFSNFGKKSVHLAAPGVKILSSVPGNKYEQISGTSMACPHVAGAAALVWGRNPSFTYKQVKAALLNSVDPLPSLTEKTITGGRLNIANALKF